MPNVHRRAVVVLVLALIAAAVVTGCSSGPSSAGLTRPAAQRPAPAGSALPPAFARTQPSTVLAIAREALTSARAVRLKGAYSDDRGHYTIDSLMTAGGDFEAAYADADGRFEVRRIGESMYLTGNDAFWRQIGAAVPTFSGKWIKAPVNDPTAAEFLALGDPKVWATRLLDTKQFSEAGAKVVPGRAVDGRGTIGLSGGGSAGTLLVATDGTGQPLLLDPVAGDDELSFTQWDAAVTVEQPAAKDVIVKT